MHERYDQLDLESLIHQALNQNIRLDEGLSLFTARQLDYLKTKAYEVEYGPMSAMSIFPVTNELPDWAMTFTYGVFDSVGMAKLIADYSDDLPMVDANYREETGRIYRIGDAYSYSLDEVKAAAHAQRNLTERKSVAARKAFDTKLNDLAWKGDSAHQIKSIWDHPNIPKTMSAGWPLTLAGAQTADSEMSAAIQSIVDLTKGTHRASKIVIPPSKNQVLNQIMPDAAGKTYRTFFQEKYPNLTWAEAYELEDIKGDGTNVKGVLIFEFDADNLSIENPEAFNQLPPQANNLHWKIPCTGKSAGLTVYRPLTVHIIQGV